MEHLIANTGIHFVTKEVEFNPSEPLTLRNGRMLKYSFCEMSDLLTGDIIFDLLCHDAAGVYVPLSELQQQGGALELTSAGTVKLDDSGVPVMSEGLSTVLFTTLKDGDAELFGIASLEAVRVPGPDNPHERLPLLDLVLGRWLPMPMFETGADGSTTGYPAGWCRVKITCTGEGLKRGSKRYRLTWAFDTTTSDDPLSVLRPCFYDEGEKSKNFSLCNKAEELMSFLSVAEGQDAFSSYLLELFGVHLSGKVGETTPAFRCLAWYLYFVNFLRLSGAAPEVQLFSGTEREMGVDLVLDIGNSRTCGVLFEEGDFTKAMMLELRDLTDPAHAYGGPFDMRVVFRKADFGGAISLPGDLFSWKSFVRVGEEARRLVYRSRQESGLHELHTNYSSPKRYLWDHKPFAGQWQNLVSVDDPANVGIDDNIYVEGLSQQFDPDGSFTGGENHQLSNRYSRGSLITFVMIEIMQQALVQINSTRFRDKHGDINCRRFLRNVILTCPTAMPVAEQVALRRAAENAWKALMKLNVSLRPINVEPAPAALCVKDAYDDSQRVWTYDEASCCQLVYLYAEMAHRYAGEIKNFFEQKGHVRPELAEEGYEKKALTIGSIDIGAGTTDLMICAYEYEGEQGTRIVSIPKYWDSFYLAGDDILRKLIQTFVIEGDMHDSPLLGCVASALEYRLLAMTDEELRRQPFLQGNGLPYEVYRMRADDIFNAPDSDSRRQAVTRLASNLLHDFFGADTNLQDAAARRNRNDFNTQVSVPIAQRLLELLRCNRPSRIYGFDELFADVKPAAYLLDSFERHFGFRFEELEWRYDPDHVAADVKSVLEPLMKQLSVVLYAYHVDVLILAGRPTSLDTVTELFIKYYPLSPDRLIRLNEYRVGTWYPFADGQGYFFDQKSVVAVGAMVGYIASHTGFNGLVVDLSRMARDMKPTSNYLGLYNPRTQQVKESLLSPECSSTMLDVHVFPAFIGCKQLDDSAYQARPLYAIYNNSSRTMLRLCLTRNFVEDREALAVDEVTDAMGNTMPADAVEVVQQSLADDGKYWLDKGEFELSL